MTETVLGFKFIHANRKDGACAVVWLDERNVDKIKKQTGISIELPAVYCDQISFEKVPIVSLEALEKKCDDWGLEKLKEWAKKEANK